MRGRRLQGQRSHGMRPHWSWLVVALAVLHVSSAATSWAGVEILIYGFEGNLEGWSIPDWAKVSSDYVGEECLLSQAHTSEGQYALELRTAFPGGRWTGAYVERQVEVTDWTPFGQLSADVYVPGDAPRGLKGKIILTVGDQWEWTEMNRSMALTPGTWTTLSVNLKPGSLDWRFFPDEHFRQSVRKIGIRIESDKEPIYRGSIFIDNIRLAE